MPGPAKVITENYREKSWTVSGALRASITQDVTSASGYDGIPGHRAGSASVAMLGITVALSMQYDTSASDATGDHPAPWTSPTFDCDDYDISDGNGDFWSINDPGYIPIEGTAHGYIQADISGVAEMVSVTGPKSDFTFDGRGLAGCPTHFPQVAVRPYTCALEQTWTVTCRITTDLVGRFNDPADSRPDCNISVADCVDELYCCRIQDRDPCWLPDTYLELWEVGTLDHTTDGVDYAVMTVEVTLGGTQYTYAVDYVRDVENQDDIANTVLIEWGLGIGNWHFEGAEDDDRLDGHYAEIISVSRSAHTDPAWTGTYSGSNYALSGALHLGGDTAYVTGTKGIEFDFNDTCPPHTRAYTFDCAYADGTTPAIAPSYRLPNERHTAWDAGSGAWVCPDESTAPVVTANHSEGYTGEWSFTSNLYNDGNPPGLEPTTHHHRDMPCGQAGGVTITNISELDEPDYPLADPPYSDRRVLAHIPALTGLHWSAALAVVEPDGAGLVGASPQIEFGSLTGWVGTDCTVTTGATLALTDLIGASPHADIDVTAENIRLTGARFAKVTWTATGTGQRCKLWIGNKWWVLRALGAGSNTTLIDLCRPNWDPGDSVSDNLQYNSSTGALLMIETDVGGDLVGALAHGCCCNWTGPADDQQESAIPVELPLDSTTHNWEHTRGWGVGRVTTIRIEPGGVSNVSLTSLQLYRFNPLHIRVFPQAHWNDSRSEAEFFNAGDGKTIVRCGDISADGAIIAEIPLGFYETYFGGRRLAYYKAPDSGPTLVRFPDTAQGFSLTAGSFPNEFLEEYGYAAFLDAVDGDLHNGASLGATVQADWIWAPDGWNLSLTCSKVFRATIRGLAFRDGLPIEMDVWAEQPGYNARADHYGVFETAALKTGTATLAHYLDVEVRSRLHGRAIVSE